MACSFSKFIVTDQVLICFHLTNFCKIYIQHLVPLLELVSDMYNFSNTLRVDISFIIHGNIVAKHHDKNEESLNLKL